MGMTYKIKTGDDLFTIAKNFGTTVPALASANGISNPNLIFAGKTLNIPETGGKPNLPDLPSNPPNSSTNSTPGYQRGEFIASDEYNTAITNKNTAYDALNGLGDFSWINQGKLDEYASKYENRDPFSYDFNTDALYQQYKDKYIKQAKMASADVMGQAAAMTGGYGSSYGQTVGNQAYQANLEKLNDVIPELYQLAYDKYNQEGQDMLNMISLLRGEREFAYGLHNDKYNRLSDELNYWTGEANNLYNRDYTAYENDEAYKYGAYRDSVQDAKDAEEMAFRKQQYEEQTAFQEKQYNDSLYNNAGGQYKVSKDSTGKPVVIPDVDATIETQKQASLLKIPGINTTETSWFDDNGKFKKAEVVETKNGKTTFKIDGKTVTYNAGVNPYTKTTNPDVKKGTFSNGYQPNNVGGKKLYKTDTQDYMNGVLQTVWTTKNGTLYIWDGLQNKYLKYEE